MRLILVRHGETAWNKEGRMMGRGDLGLNERGREQAEAIALRLRSEPVDAIYSSPLARARETAQAIAQCHGTLKVQQDGRLLEMDAGELHGLTRDEAHERYSAYFKEWIEDPAVPRAPGGESLAEVQQRVLGFLGDMKAKPAEATVVGVTHHFPIIVLVCHALDLPLQAFRRFRVDLGSLSVLQVEDDHVRLLALNDTCHVG